MDLLFLTELLGLAVHDLKGRVIGRVKDAALVPVVHRSRIDRYLVGAGSTWLTVRYDQVRAIGLDGVYLRDEQLTPYHNDEWMLRIVRDLLDQQIIDAAGRKVVRVSDITFEILRTPDGMTLDLVDVDIGLRSVLRRVAQGVVPPSWVRRIQAPIAPHSIPWTACTIVEADPQRRLHLNVSYRALEALHPADIADIVEDLGPDEREAIFETIDEEVAGEALSEVDPDVQASILESLEPEKAADIIEEMAPDQAADVLGELEEATAEEILDEMEPASKTEVTGLLEYDAESAGGLMTTDYVAVAEQATAADALAEIRAHEHLIDALTTVYLVDGSRRLTGAVPLARLAVAPPETPLQELAGETPQRVALDERQDRVTDRFDKYNLLALPVVDARNRLVGVITADDIISVLRVA
jgi:flagellar motility protein MotE (MotC chaperone)/sporulation protein YlmC with PRC-barrel domain